MSSLLKKKLKEERQQLISDKNGVCIDCDQGFNNGTLSLFVNKSEKIEVVSLRVKNNGREPVFFTECFQLHSSECITLKDELNVTKDKPLLLQPGNSYTIEVHFHCSQVGCYEAEVAFEFKLHHPTTAFYIVRSIKFRCRTTLGQKLGPTSPFKPPSFTARTPEVDYEIVEGQRPKRLSSTDQQNGVRLNHYPIPKYMYQRTSAAFRRKSQVLQAPLSWENYSEKFHLLLYLEEQKMKEDIKKYNIPNDDREEATMTRDQSNKNLLVLEVPGVAENRPSVLPGDKLLVCPLGEKTKYRGHVHSVQLNSVLLCFHQKLLDRFEDGMKFSVEFTISDLTLRLQHRAAELAVEKKLQKVLFPPHAFPSQQTELPRLRLFDSNLESNPEQYQAIQHIVAGSSRPAPYLVFGPPGTGKTVTLAEAIKQIVMNQASCHILACAPTNSAADQLCEQILMFKPYRLFARGLESKHVPDILKACSNLDGGWHLPTKAELMDHRIIVTTLYTAGRLVTSGIPEGHFTHIFVDEAGNALETECLIPLAGLLCAKSGQVVLAGDPKQLGPIVRSSLAKKYGMGVSLLERLMKDFPLYSRNEKGVFNNHFVTKLLNNYRSHPAILNIPSKLFYDGELKACARENSLCSWAALPKQGFPVIFHGVKGVDEREASSPSFFNVTEVEVLMEYVVKLLQKHAKKGQPAVSPSDIGIIAPYRKQVQKICQALDNVGKNHKDLKVGSVEEFQGQERRVIMVSTVRSSPDYTEIDKQFSLGFVKNEKRFNVAVTRAKALLIVVGNPRVLNTDETWAQFIQYCKDEGGYTGFTPVEDDEDMVMRLSALYKSIEAKADHGP
ncbi:putative helicase mov-10-B.1 isoform X2 [Acanthopagrus latus]|uniref:putative helicase mov-10-B.1 isoform X2 n=1 Tax=Acanthopagrus latus TaxID=8177 RepID=UPI00187CD683|nr:putative helicase mov-10-B.1 isoform X2 [Acanthopagrus latus]